MGGAIAGCCGDDKPRNQEKSKGDDDGSGLAPLAPEKKAAKEEIAEDEPAPKKRFDNHIKLVLVGDTAVGKSCLIVNYLNNTFSDDYEPTVLDVYKGTKNVNKKQMELEIHDTSGDEELYRNREITYNGADVFLVCVASNQRSSFEHVGKWVSEVRGTVGRNVPIWLIMTKSDLMDDDDAEAVNMKEMQEEKARLGLMGVKKTSSKEWEDFNVHKAFSFALESAYTAKNC